MFIPRHPVVENQFCQYGATTSGGAAGIGGVVAYAGAVVYLDSTATNQEAMVYTMGHASSLSTPFGVSMQKVKAGYHQVHPVGMSMPGDLGSSDVIAQPTYSAAGAITGTKATPVGVAHLGIWDTVHYTSLNAVTALAPGDNLFAAADGGKLTSSTAYSDGSTDAATGARCNATVVAKVVKGASVAKATANIANTTQYPIRIKLLV